jgi:hypothetical protein
LEAVAIGHLGLMVECLGRRYLRIWRAAVVVLTGIGVVASLLFVSPAIDLAAFLVAAFTTGTLGLGLGLARELTTVELARSSSRWAVLAGLVVLAICGYGAAVGLDTLVLLVLIAVTAPPVLVRFLPRKESEDPAPTPRRAWIRLPQSAKAAESASVREPAAPPVDFPIPLYLEAVARSLSEMTDEELCLAWRRSFKHLESSVDSDRRTVMADVRRAYLDELERRHPEEFAAWLASGPRAAGDPARFLIHRADH